MEVQKILFVKGILIILLISDMKSEDLLPANDEEKLPTLALTSTKKDLNLKTDQPTGENIDLIALGLENFASTAASLAEPATILNDFKDKETTSSWELIYHPAQNFSATTSTPSANVADSFKTVLPKYFKVDDVTNCQKFFDQCLKQVLANVVPKLKDGHKSPSLDPLYFNATAFQYNSGPLSGYITIRYALVYGLITMKFQKVDFYKEHDQFKARLNMLVPKMSVIGGYKGDMQVNNARVRPRGDFNVSMTALGVEMLSLGVLYKKDDHTFLKFTKANATTTLKNSKINATGIFPDQRLNDIVVNVANQYWRDLFNIVLPETRNNWLPVLLDALNSALEMVPFDFFDIKS